MLSFPGKNAENYIKKLLKGWDISMTVKEIQPQSIKEYNLPVLFDRKNRSLRPYAPENIKKISHREKSENYSQSPLTDDKVFEDIEKNTIFLKAKSDKNKQFLIDEVKKLLREKKDDIWPENDIEKENTALYFIEDDSIIKADNYRKEKNFEDGGTREYNREENTGIFSFEDLRKKIFNNLNLNSFMEMVSGQKDIISFLAKASEEVFNFIDTVKENLYSLAPKDRLKNMAALKGLMFDALA